MGNACNFAKDDEELEFEKQIMSARKGAKDRGRTSTFDQFSSSL